MKIIVSTIALGLLAGGCQIPGTPTVAQCGPVLLQDLQNLHQIEASWAAIKQSPVTVTPPPVMTQPPPVEVTPTPGGMVVTPTTQPVPSPGPTIVTPSAKLRRHAAIDDMQLVEENP